MNVRHPMGVLDFSYFSYDEIYITYVPNFIFTSLVYFLNSQVLTKNYPNILRAFKEPL